MVECTLNRAQADDLFQKESVLFDSCGNDGIPEHKIVDLFGASAGEFIEHNIHLNGYLVAGRDYNSHGSCKPGDPCLRYFYRSGFYKIVAEHNHALTIKQRHDSEGGRIMDALWQARSDRLDAEDAESKRKRAVERKAKRSTASPNAKETGGAK